MAIKLPPSSALFTTPLTIPIEKDSNPSSTLKAFPLLAAASSVTFTLDEVVLATIRHLHICDASGATWAPPKIPTLAQEWCAVLRWHIKTFWDIDFQSNSIFPKSHGYTFEHHRYSGELMAEGLSVLVIDKIEKILPQHVFFYKAAGARPDFVITAGATGFIAGAMLVALEARCRQHESFSFAGESSGLKLKKTAGFSDLLGSYFVHSPPYKRKPVAASHERTRLFISDPPDSGAFVDDIQRALATVLHYNRVCSEIGLGDFRAILVEIEKTLRTTGFPTIIKANYDRSNFGMRRPQLSRQFGAATYEGRQFQFNGDSGSIAFYGVNTEVLRLIVQHDALSLATFRDPEAEINFGISSDGVVLRSEGS